MFQFAGFAPFGNISSIYWVAPFGNLRVKLCAPNRSLSQLITSFFASESLGIRHTPLISLLYSFASLIYKTLQFYYFMIIITTINCNNLISTLYNIF